MKKTYKILLVIFSVLFITPVSVINASEEAYGINTNPGENAAVEMRVSWHMDTSKTNGKIIYTTKDDQDWDNAITLYPESYLSNVFHNEEFLHYNATLSDLIPKTEYMYKVGQNILSEVYYFKTAGEDSFSFILSGDWHAYMPLPQRVENAMDVIKEAEKVEPNIDFLLSVGDVVAHGSDYEAWLHLLKQEPYKKYMNVNTIGNHDVMNNVGGANTDDYFAGVHNFPKNGFSGQEGKTYYFLYNNSLFFVLNNEDNTPIKDVQDWMKSVIENIPTKYIFVSMHYNWFSGITGSNYQYNNWKNFFDQNEVDLAMSGHNHVYVRTHKLLKDKVSNDKGTVYIQVPSADNDRGREMNNTISNSDKIAKRWTEGVKTVGAIIVTVNLDKITTKLIDRAGNIIEEVDIQSQTTLPEFDKTNFQNSFSIHPSVTEDAVVISSSVEGVGRIEKIEYYNEETLLKTNHYIKKSDITQTINNVSSYEFISAKIYFKDKKTKEVNLKVPHKDFYEAENFDVVIMAEEFYLKWDYLGENDIKAWIFINGEPLKEIDLNAELVLLNDIEITDIVEVRPDKDSNFTYYYSIYNIKGDANLDGLINEEDIHLIQQHLLGIEDVDPLVLSYLDVDLDNELTLYDMTYIHAYIKDYLDSISYNIYTVTYLDAFGKIISTEQVKSGSSGTFPELILNAGYVLSSWDTSIKKVKQDLFVKMIIEFVGEFNE